METNAAETWIYSKLTADAALTAVVGTRIYNTRRPTGSTFPCVVFQYQGGRDLVFVGAIRGWSEMTYLVRGISETFDTGAQGSYEGDLKTIANRIDAVLHGSSGTNANGTVYTSVRASPFQMIDTVDGRQFRHLGSLLTIQAR